MGSLVVVIWLYWLIIGMFLVWIVLLLYYEIVSCLGGFLNYSKYVFDLIVSLFVLVLIIVKVLVNGVLGIKVYLLCFNFLSIK